MPRSFSALAMILAVAVCMPAGTRADGDKNAKEVAPRDIGNFRWSKAKPDFNLGFRVFEPKLRVFFDTGKDDEGEVDAFNNGAVAVTVNLIEVRYDLSWLSYAYVPQADDPERVRAYITSDEEPKLVDPNWVDSSLPKPDEPVHDKRITPKKLDLKSKRTPFSFGVAVGGGIAAPVEGTSNAPILLVTAGCYAEYKVPLFDTSRFESLQRQAEEIGFSLKAPSIILETGGAFGFSTEEGLNDSDDAAVYVGLGLHIPFGT